MKTKSPKPEPKYSDAGVPVRARTAGDIGRTTGSTHRCSLAGCTGIRLSVRWSSGEVTFPCSKGMVRFRNGWKLS